MNTADIKQQMRHIAEQMLDDSCGVSWLPVADAWKSTNADELGALGGDLVDALVQRLAREIVADMRRAGNGEMTLPGIGDIDTTVTTRNAEGAFIVKHIRHATQADLVVDAEVQEDNLRSALSATRRARTRNRTLIPVMEEQGFRTAGEAMQWLETHG